MREELQEKLYTKYPKLFVQKDKSIEETCICLGIETGDGWYKLIDCLCETIQSYVDSNKKQQPEVVQAKQKFGGLRFYVDGTDKLIDGMIWFAGHLSYKTCEECGSTENVTVDKGGYIRSLCKKCRDKK